MEGEMSRQRKASCEKDYARVWTLFWFNYVLMNVHRNTKWMSYPANGLRSLRWQRAISIYFFLDGCVANAFVLDNNQWFPWGSFFCFLKVLLRIFYLVWITAKSYYFKTMSAVDAWINTLCLAVKPGGGGTAWGEIFCAALNQKSCTLITFNAQGTLLLANTMNLKCYKGLKGVFWAVWRVRLFLYLFLSVILCNFMYCVAACLLIFLKKKKSKG